MAKARRRAGLTPAADVELRYPPVPAASPLAVVAAELRAEVLRTLNMVIPFLSLAANQNETLQGTLPEDALDRLELLLHSGQLMMPEQALLLP